MKTELKKEKIRERNRENVKMNIYYILYLYGVQVGEYLLKQENVEVEKYIGDYL